MEKLLIESTKSSPLINFDPQMNILEIEGQSFPENAAIFYEPIFKWLNDYLYNLNSLAIVKIKLTYLNTSSSKIMLNLFDMLDKEYLNGKKISVNWYYDEENEISYECGEEFMEGLNLPFKLIKING